MINGQLPHAHTACKGLKPTLPVLELCGFQLDLTARGTVVQGIDSLYMVNASKFSDASNNSAVACS